MTCTVDRVLQLMHVTDYLSGVLGLASASHHQS